MGVFGNTSIMETGIMSRYYREESMHHFAYSLEIPLSTNSIVYVNHGNDEIQTPKPLQ